MWARKVAGFVRKSDPSVVARYPSWFSFLLLFYFETKPLNENIRFISCIPSVTRKFEKCDISTARQYLIRSFLPVRLSCRGLFRNLTVPVRGVPVWDFDCTLISMFQVAWPWLSFVVVSHHFQYPHLCFKVIKVNHGTSKPTTSSKTHNKIYNKRPGRRSATISQTSTFWQA